MSHLVLTELVTKVFVKNSLELRVLSLDKGQHVGEGFRVSGHVLVQDTELEQV